LAVSADVPPQDGDTDEQRQERENANAARVVRRQQEMGLTGGYRSDRCAMTQSGDFEAEDTRRDHKACVEAKQVCNCCASV
jgi:hypothetical protein